MQHDNKTTPVFLTDGGASWFLLASLISLVSDSTVQLENAYSWILKVTGQVEESEKWKGRDTNHNYHQHSSP